MSASLPARVRALLWGPWGLAAGLYLLGSLVFLWPLPTRMADAVWGDRFDAWTTMWLIDHLAQRLSSFSFGAETDLILYPMGYNLWSFGHLALQAIGAVWVALGVPVVLAYNLLFVLGLWTSGLAAHAFGKELAGSHLAGAVAGIVFATSPYLYSEGAAGCIELVAAGLLPLYGLTLVRLMRSPDRTRALHATLALAIIGPFNWYYTLFAGMFGVGFVAWRVLAAGGSLLRPEGRRARKAIGLAMASMSLAAALDAPLIAYARRETPTRPPIHAELFQDITLWERASAVMNGAVPLEELNEAELLQADAQQVALNATPLINVLKGSFEVNPLGSTPGALAYGVGLLALAAGRRRTTGWLVMAAGATVFTLGPYLNLDGSLTISAQSGRLPLPYYFAYEHLPFFSKAYRPYRIGVIALQCLAAAGAVGMASLALSVPRRWLWAGVGVLGLVGFTQPLWAGVKPASRPLADAAIPDFYSELRDAPDGAVIEVPLQYQPVTVANSRFQYNQVVHRKPLLNSNQLIRRPDLLGFRDYVLGNGLLQVLLNLSRSAPPYAISDDDIAALREDGFRYVVAHRLVPGDSVRLAGSLEVADMLRQPAWAMLREGLGEPVITGEAGWVFELPDVSGQRLRTWTGADFVDVATPMDLQTLGLSPTLQEGEAMPLYTGDARSLSLWVHPVKEASVGTRMEGLGLRVEGTGRTRELPIPMVAGFWRWEELEMPLSGPVQLSLVNLGEGALDVEVTGVQVRR